MSGTPSVRPSTWGAPPPQRDRGSATVLVAAALGVTALFLCGALALVSAALASHRARAAADLAALAAADVLVHGLGGDPCDRAASVAADNHAWLDGCAVAGDAVTVTVGSASSWPGLGAARARARAGPGEARVPAE